MRRATLGLVTVACIGAFYVFFLFVPIFQGIAGDCIFTPGEQQSQSLSFPLIGIGMTIAGGHLSWRSSPMPSCW